jgi:hypothetical protein
MKKKKSQKSKHRHTKEKIQLIWLKNLRKLLGALALIAGSQR